MYLEEQLIEIIKFDITELREKISQEHEFLEHFIKESNPKEGVYFIEFSIFEDLINTYFIKPNNLENDPIRRYVPSDRLSLFRQIFLENMDFSTNKTILWYHHGAYYSEERLYYLLFYHLFMLHLFTQNSIESIFNKALKVWRSSFKDNIMPIVIDILLPHTNFVDLDEILISDNLKLIYIKSYYSLTGHNLSVLNENFKFLGVILRLNCFQSFNHNFYGGFIRPLLSMDDPEFKEEFDKQIISLRECIFSLYLNNFNFILEGYEIHYPWWIQGDLKEYKMSDIKLDQNRITSQDQSSIIDLYKKIHENDILNDNELELVLFNYFELLQKDLISELILYDFIILENFFTRGSTSEVKFRLALNLALFISVTQKELLEIFEVMKKLYNIRSRIIHGEAWHALLRRKEIPKLLGIDPNANNKELAKMVHSKLLNYINRSLNIIINLKIDNFKENNNYALMSQFKDLYFLKNSQIFQGKWD